MPVVAIIGAQWGDEGKGKVVDMLAQQATFSMNKEAHAKGVLRIKQAIRAGDVMQVVLSQRISLPFAASPVALYRALRCLSPAPYMYHLNLGDLAVVGASPEILVRLEQGELTERPIAGTRPRGQSAAEDMALGYKQLQRVEESFSDFRDLGGYMLPSTWVLKYFKNTDQGTILLQWTTTIEHSAENGAIPPNVLQSLLKMK